MGWDVASCRRKCARTAYAGEDMQVLPLLVNPPPAPPLAPSPPIPSGSPVIEFIEFQPPCNGERKDHDEIRKGVNPVYNEESLRGFEEIEHEKGKLLRKFNEPSKGQSKNG